MANSKKQDSGEQAGSNRKDVDPQRGSSASATSSSSSGAKSADMSMMSSTPSSTLQERPKTIGSTSTSKQVRYSFQKKPFVIGVAGGTASGKSTVCSKIMEKLGPLDPKNSSSSSASTTTSSASTAASAYLAANQKRVICISQDSFYRKLTEEDRASVAKGNFNFDHPAAFDVPLLVSTLHEVLNGKMVKVPLYNYMENEISNTEEVIYPADVVLVEGLLLFYFPEVRDMFQMKIFVDTDPDTRLSRRVMRDVTERHRALDVVLSQYTKFVKPSFEEFCLPTKKYADIIVPRGPDNEVAVDLIVTHVQSIFDPSTRHQSIKPYDDCLPAMLSSFETTAAMIAEHRSATSSKRSSTSACILKKPVPPNRARGVGVAGSEEPLTVANVLKCNGVTSGHENGLLDYKSKPIAIKVGGSGSGSGEGGRVSSPHSPLLRNGFTFGLSSSSAPSHYSSGSSSITNGHHSHHDHNLIIDSEEEEEEIGLTGEGEDSVFKGNSPLVGQSQTKSRPTVVANGSSSTSSVANSVANGTSNSTTKPTPILLVASR